MFVHVEVTGEINTLHKKRFAVNPKSAKGL